MELKQVQRMLVTNFWLMVAIVVLMVVVYETELLSPTSLGDDVQLVFVLQVAMELVTIVMIPVALKLFALKGVRRKLAEGKGDALMRWGTARLNMLCLPMLVNTFLYYQTMSPAFGYMGIIVFLCLFFVYPSMGRCVDETRDM